MKKITCKADLLAAYEQCKGLLVLRETGVENRASVKKDILVCGETGCRASGAHEIADKLRALVEEKGLQNDVKVLEVGCFGFCEVGPIVKIEPDNVFYVHADDMAASEIINDHIIGGKLVERLLYVEPTLQQRVTDYKQMSFYRKQKRIALKNCGLIDPRSLEEFIAAKGYQALGKCLFDMKPEDVIKCVKDSGLRGRGGAGFPTGKKWEIAASYHTEQKYIICNADEGDPGAFMDRSIMEGDPHTILEAMTIGAYAIGATHGVIYIRAEYPSAVRRLQNAMAQARELGTLGKNIMGTDFSFDIEIKLGAGAFVCGEETALIHSTEGSRGEPTTKPPFPAQSGLWKQSTNVNNVETYANVPQIVLNGAEWFSAIGTADSKGTKVFALAGDIVNVGLVEVPMGTTLREIVFEIGGGIRGGRKFKAVQTGGPSGGCLAEGYLDTPIDYGSLTKAGSMMGSGGMIVLSEKDCMVNIARFYLDFTADESCGRCTPCRIGTRRMLEMLDKITAGEGTMELLNEVEQLGETIRDTALCGLGQTAPNPVLSTIKCFKDEYIAHIVDKHCPSGSCAKLYSLEITAKCIGCGMCKRACPADAISGEKKERHIIDKSKCIKCGACISACKFGAIVKA